MIKRINAIVAILVVGVLTAMGCLAYTQQRQEKESNRAVSPADVQKKIDDLRSTDPLRREAAACDLRKMGASATAAIPALIELLGDNTEINPQQSCRRQSRYGNTPFSGMETVGEFSPGEAATEALIAIGEPVVLPVIAALHQEQWRVRKNAARVLAFRTDGRAVEPLIAALKDETWQVRSEAAVALGNYKDERAVAPLIAALSDSSWEVRDDAAVSLGNYKDERAVAPLIAASKDQAWQVRMDAVVALAHINDSRAVEPLIAALSDTAWQVRMEAALGLAHVGDTRAIQPLTAALQDENPRVRKEAQSAIEQINRRAERAARR